MIITTCRSVALSVVALWSLPVFAGDLPPPVTVAPGGVYINAARVYVAPNAGYGAQPYAPPPAPAYVPGYGPYAPEYGAPGPVYAPGYPPPLAYGPPPVVVYGRPPVGARTYAAPYPTEYAPRPPAGVPYDGAQCAVSYGRMVCY